MVGTYRPRRRSIPLRLTIFSSALTSRQLLENGAVAAVRLNRFPSQGHPQGTTAAAAAASDLETPAHTSPRREVTPSQRTPTIPSHTEFFDRVGVMGRSAQASAPRGVYRATVQNSSGRCPARRGTVTCSVTELRYSLFLSRYIVLGCLPKPMQYLVSRRPTRLPSIDFHGCLDPGPFSVGFCKAIDCAPAWTLPRRGRPGATAAAC